MAQPMIQGKSLSDIYSNTRPEEYFLKPGRGLECLKDGNVDYCNEASSLRKSSLGNDRLVELLGVRKTSYARGRRKRSSRRRKSSDGDRKDARRSTGFRTQSSSLGSSFGMQQGVRSAVSFTAKPLETTITQIRLAAERARQTNQNFLSMRIVSIHGERLLSCLKLIGRKMEILGILPQLVSRLIVGDSDIESTIGEECTSAMLQLLYIQTAWLLQRSQARPESEFFLGQTLRQIKRKLQKGVRARAAKLTFTTEHTIGDDEEGRSAAGTLDSVFMKSKSDCTSFKSDGDDTHSAKRRRLPQMSCFRASYTHTDDLRQMEKMEKLQKAIDDYGERCEYISHAQMQSKMLEHTVPDVATPAEKIFRDIFYEPIVHKRNTEKKKIKLRVCHRKSGVICCRPYNKTALKSGKRITVSDMASRMKSPLDAFLSDDADDRSGTREGVFEDAEQRKSGGACESLEEHESIESSSDDEEEEDVEETNEEFNFCTAALPSQKQQRLAILEEILEHPEKSLFLQRIATSPRNQSSKGSNSVILSEVQSDFSACSSSRSYDRRMELIRSAVEGPYGKQVLKAIASENLQHLLHFIQLDRHSRKRNKALVTGPVPVSATSNAPASNCILAQDNKKLQWRKRWKEIMSLQKEALVNSEKPKRGWNLSKDNKSGQLILVKHYQNHKGQWQSKKIRLNASGEPETPQDKLNRRIDKVKRKINRRFQIKALRQEFGTHVPRGALENYSRITVQDEEDHDSTPELQSKVIENLGNRRDGEGEDQNFDLSSDPSITDSDNDQNMDVVVTDPYPYKKEMDSKPRIQPCLNPDSAFTDYLGIPPQSDSYKLGYIPVLMAGYNIGRIAALELPQLGPDTFGISPETYHTDQLRGSYREVFRLINLNPNNVTYILDQMEPDASASLQAFCNQIQTLQKLMFARLIISPEEEVMRVHLLKQTWIREQRLLKLLNNLKEEYTGLEKKKEVMLANLNESINNFIGQIDNVYMHTHQEIVKTIAEYTKMELLTTKSADHDLQELHSILHRCVTAASVMRAKYAEAEEQLQKQKRKLEAELEVKISQYDAEMFARQEQLDKLIQDVENNKMELGKIEKQVEKTELQHSAMLDDLQLKLNVKKKKKPSKKKKGKKSKKSKKKKGKRRGRGKSKKKGKGKGKSKSKKRGRKGRKTRSKKLGVSSDEEDESGMEEEEDETDASKTDSEGKKKKKKGKSSKKTKRKTRAASTTKGKKKEKKGSKKRKQKKKKKKGGSRSDGESLDEEEYGMENGGDHLSDLDSKSDNETEEESEAKVVPRKKGGKSPKGANKSVSSGKSTSASSKGGKQKKKKKKKKRKSKKSKKSKKRKKGSKIKKKIRTKKQQLPEQFKTSTEDASGIKDTAETGAETEFDFNEPPTPPEIATNDTDLTLPPSDGETSTVKHEESSKDESKEEEA